MRKLLLIIVIVLVAVLAGWVTFSRSPGEASFTIETGKMQEDAERALQEGKRVIRENVSSDAKPQSTKPTTKSYADE